MTEEYELPISELMEKLAEFDEITILELLEVDSEQLVYYLRDLVVEKQDELRWQIQDQDEDD
jgi:hypothetical protein